MTMSEDLAALAVDREITRARTLPGWVYTRPDAYQLALERVFARSWHYAADLAALKVPGACLPVRFLEGSLDEPILLARDREDRLHCFSNVCTHRGTIVCAGAGVFHELRCRYHGRRFELDGRFKAMPEFEGVADFPSASDDLPRVALASLGTMGFAALDPAMGFDELSRELAARIGWLPLSDAVLDSTRSRDYLVKANWALYCENYLEGFHIPYVHANLAGALDYDGYRVELLPWGSLQVGAAARGDAGPTFDLPRASPDHGERIAAYYYWLWPATMLNVYPWGISLNVVRPLAPDRTRVSFLSFVWDAALLERGAGAGLDRVEREDEGVVEEVQRGVASRLYQRGRYSPRRELGVHHFHRLLAAALSGAAPA